jgi:hypothetical protein
MNSRPMPIANVSLKIKSVRSYRMVQWTRAGASRQRGNERFPQMPISELQSLEGREMGALGPGVSQQLGDTTCEMRTCRRCSDIPLSKIATWGVQPSDCCHRQDDRKHGRVRCGIPTLTFHTSLDDTAWPEPLSPILRSYATRKART